MAREPGHNEHLKKHRHQGDARATGSTMVSPAVANSRILVQGSIGAGFPWHRRQWRQAVFEPQALPTGEGFEPTLLRVLDLSPARLPVPPRRPVRYRFASDRGRASEKSTAS